MIRWFLIVLILAIMLLSVAIVVKAEEPAIWKVLMAEAVSEGYDGMYAVACVIRNRGGDLNGFYGGERKDLDDFCKRQGQRYILQAQEIERLVFKENAPSNVGNATHFEAIEKYGIPYWAKDMKVVYKVGEHTFYVYK